MPRRFALTAAALLLTLLAAKSASAQTVRTPGGDVFAGVAIWNEDDARFDAFQLSAGYRPWRFVSIIGDLAFYDHRTTLMGGARVQAAGTGRFAPFAQIMMGNAPLDDIALQPGGGVDIRLARHFAVRLAADLKISGDDGKTFIGSRVSAGGVITFGRR